MKKIIVLLSVFILGIETVYAGQFLKVGSTYVNKSTVTLIESWNLPANSIGKRYRITFRSAGATYFTTGYQTPQERDKQFKIIEKWLKE